MDLRENPVQGLGGEGELPVEKNDELADDAPSSEPATTIAMLLSQAFLTLSFPSSVEEAAKQ